MTATDEIPAIRQYGTGWYVALWSGDLGVGDVMPLRYFGADLVAFRGESGEVFVLDAHCHHMGAHLAYGGEVTGDDIICPFHHWQWRGSDGANTNIPYLDRCVKVALRRWRTLEQDGIVYLWFSRKGDEEPTYLPPRIAEADDPSYYPLHPHGIGKAVVGFPPQFAFENVADISHLRTVHKWSDEPVLNAPGPTATCSTPTSPATCPRVRATPSCASRTGSGASGWSTAGCTGCTRPRRSAPSPRSTTTARSTACRSGSAGSTTATSRAGARRP
ncbi:hypothetical protein BJF78_00615 [Pseudonocardia sp. CNS-139]|nr:hypothetical protein BJF78_00615 [Pseudonocardia sp. CNS-139]